MIQARFYDVLRRTTSQTTRNRLKHVLFRFRSGLDPVYVAMYGRFDAADLEREIRLRVGDQFEILMVHSSFNALRPMYSGTVQGVIDTLLRVCGSHATLVMPAFFFGRAGLDVATYYSQHPVFNESRTASQTGIISEAFRRMEGVKRSLHPTHSVCALGPMADELTARHHLCPTTFGQRTPFDAMTLSSTVILGLGVHFYRCLTHVHVAEDVLGPDFPLQHAIREMPVTLKKADGTSVNYVLRVNDLSKRYRRRIDLLRSMLERGDLSEWSYRGVPMFWTTARRVSDALCDAARQGRTLYRI